MKRLYARISLAALALLAAPVSLWALEKVDGAYPIGTAEEFVEFSNLVNGGEADASAYLTADIDLSSAAYTPIGTDVYYQGVFDGRGHSVTVNITATEDVSGLFAFVGGSQAVVKNLIVRGTVATSAKFAGGVVGALHTRATVENCTSYVSINSSVNGDGTHGGIVGYVTGEGASIINCHFAGSINGEQTDRCGGITGWLSAGNITVSNCLISGEMNVLENGCATFCRNSGNANITNCYYRDGFVELTDQTRGTKVSADQLKSGEVTFALNKNNVNGCWRQTLGEDQTPVLSESSKKVYAIASEGFRCDGAPQGEVTYTNEEQTINIPAHQYEGYVCSVCGYFDRDFVQPQDGVYPLSNALELAWFADMVNTGHNDMNACLTADITLAENELPMIGTEQYHYTGTFDGQQHTVTINKVATEARTALFRHLEGTVRNLHTAGLISTEYGYACGIAAIMYGCLIENCISSVEIHIALGGQDHCHSGIAGRATGGGNIIRNCVFNGKITGEAPQSSSGFVGWAPNGTLVQDCLQIASIEIDGSGRGCFNIGWGTGLSVSGTYYLNAWGVLSDGTTQITDDGILTSGQLCYMLNGEQNEIKWTQTLGEDAIPYPWTTHKQVYAINGNILCSGAFDPDHMPSFSNENTNPATRDEHTFNKDGVCTKCGFVDASAVPQLVDGYYEILNATQLRWFATEVANNQPELNARLIADIDLGDNLYMIGTDVNPYAGIFDGQGHSITFDFVATEARTALFRHLKGTVRNLHTQGRISSQFAYACGMAAIMYGCTIENCISSVEIYNAVADQDFCHSGFCGRATGGGNIIRNCIFDGKLAGEAPQSASSFVGWAPNSTLVENCLQIGEFEMGGGGRGCCTFGWSNGSMTVRNCYYRTSFGYYNSGSTQVTDEQLASGEICMALNQGQEEINWSQALGVDPHPFCDASHGAVYLIFDSYINDGQDNFHKAINAELAACQEMLTNKQMLDDYIEAVNDLSQYDNITDLLEAYTPLVDQRKALFACRDAYEAYKAKVDEVQAYTEAHPEMTGEKADLLIDYLTTDIEPNEDYPNGAALYIMENGLLNEEEIKAETAQIDEMLKQAIISSPTPGTEITPLLVNPEFRDGFNGWEGTVGTGTTVTEPMAAAQCLARPMDMYQTITGLQNGIYELQINGLFRPNDEFDGTNYAALLYANGIQNYFQAGIEDMLPANEAVDGENCNISGSTPDYLVIDDGGNEVGYIAYGPLGCCYAFQNGRYTNSVLVEVTDGSLTVGMKKLSTRSNAIDWLGFGNVKVFYRGALNQATDAMKNVLGDMAARATTMITVYESSSSTEYPYHPNFSKEVKDKLSTLNSKVAEKKERTAQEYYEMIQQYSDLFQQVYDCKNAYIELADYIETLFELQLHYPNLETEIDQKYNESWKTWEEGGYTQQGAIDKKKELEEWVNAMISADMPEPNLLDVVFNEDGSATDRSPLGHEISEWGEPSVVMNPDVKMNIFDQTAIAWGANQQHSYSFDMTGDLWDKMADGFSIEALVCPTWDGDNVPTGWCGILGAAQQGGFLFGVSSQKWLFQASINGSWANGRGDELLVKDKWTHLIGVWDKDLGTLSMYVDGRLTGTASASGELLAPQVVDDTKLYIGADMDGSVSGTMPQASFQGKIAYVRMYDMAMPGAAAGVIFNNALATSIDEIASETKKSAPTGIYNLMGQRVQKATRGIFIIDGKKKFVK